MTIEEFLRIHVADAPPTGGARHPLDPPTLEKIKIGLIQNVQQLTEAIAQIEERSGNSEGGKKIRKTKFKICEILEQTSNEKATSSH